MSNRIDILTHTQKNTQPLFCEHSAHNKVKLINSEKGNLQGYSCPECLNRGYFAFVDDSENIAVYPCSCMVKRKAEDRIKKSRLGDLHSRCTLNNFLTEQKSQQSALESANNFLKSISSFPWLFTFGRPGTGKTHLCVGICHELLDMGYDVSYMKWRDGSRKIKAVVNSNVEYERLVSPLKEVQVLYIDDFLKSGSKNITPPDISLAYEIINNRYIINGLITIISTEFSLSEISTFDAALAGRIFERSKNFSLDFSQCRNMRK